MDLSEYIEIEAGCRSLSLDVDGLSNKLDSILKSISEEEEALREELESISSNKEQYVRKSISEQIYSSTHTQQNQLRTLQESLEVLKAQPYTPNKEAITAAFAKDIELCDRVLKGIVKDKKENKNLFEIIQQNNTEDYSKYAPSLIRSKLAEYKSGSSRQEEFEAYSQISNKLVNNIFKVASLFKHLKGSARLGFLISYYALVCVMLIVAQPVIVLWYIKLSVSFISSDKEFRGGQIKEIGDIAVYQKLAEQLKLKIKIKMQDNISQDMQHKLEEKAELTKSLRKDISELSKKIALVESTVRDQMTKYSQTNDYEKEQRAEIEGKHRGTLENLTIIFKQAMQFLNENKQQLGEMLLERDKGKKELEEMYFMLDRCGDSKILPKQFLLGFNEYLPVTLDMPNYCINLLASRNNGKNNVDFVIMCLAQILCTTNPSCVKINIVDIESGTTNFGIFNNIPEIITVIKTTEELNDKLEELFELKAARDRDIKKVADNITLYNEVMIANYGLTTPYEIIIVTHHIDALMDNQIYHQLQMAGDLGIVTITMWEQSLVRYTPKNTKEYYAKVIPLLENMENMMYYGGTGDLTPLSKEYIREKLIEIKKMLRSAK